MGKQEKKIKKVLIVIASYSAFRNPLKKAFRSLDIMTSFFDNRKTTLFEKMIFASSLVIPHFYSLATRQLNNRLVKQIQRFKPDLVLVSKGENILPGTVKAISKNTIIVNWFTDFFDDFKMINKWLSVYSFFFTGDRQDVKTYRKKGYENLFCLPYAGPTISTKHKNRMNDVVFIGSYSPTREKLFEEMKSFNLKIWGDDKWAKSKLSGNYMGKWLNQDGVKDVLTNSKIVINHHQNRVLNMRVYEATAAGAMLITDNAPDLHLMFKVGREVILYNNQKDLYKKIKYYLKNDDLRAKIAQSGYLRTKNDHNYTNRIKLMFSIIRKGITTK